MEDGRTKLGYKLTARKGLTEKEIMINYSFKVWHPKYGGVPSFKEQSFSFNDGVSKRKAASLIEKIDGFVIERKKVKEQRVRQKPVRQKKQKVSI